MIQYIYFVKCPNCEDEHFDFFDEAKEFALGCLGNKPVITQTEVCRNDFGECTTSSDLGTVWSWEDEVDLVDDNVGATVFTKDAFAEYDPDRDPEFDALDNSVDYVPDELDTVPDNFRKPIPEGMTLEELVEEMEENEDAVECTWCEELFDKSECRYEVDLGWLCARCEAAIKSRGETLTFREGSYWDFLDEDPQDASDAPDDSNTVDTVESLTWVCVFDGKEVGTVEAATEDEALEKMQQDFPEYNYGEYDGCFEVFPDVNAF